MVKFKDRPDFKPDLTPKQIFEKGAFGGTYYRDIYSSITKKSYKNAWKEFPKEWFKNIDINTYVASDVCDKNINKYKVKSGSSLKDWEKKGWITEQDPYGWIQWYCRFYLGRRTEDDDRQIKRFNGIAGENGRFKKWLTRLQKEGKDSPKMKQLLLQWGAVP